MIQWVLAIWSLAPLPFLNPAWTSGSSWFIYCWGLAWRILSITLLICAAAAAKSLQSCPTLCDPIDGSSLGSPIPGTGSLSILWHCLSLRLEWKLTFSSSVATVEFSKFAGILSVALSQHHISGFEIAQLEFHHLNCLCSWWCFRRPTWLLYVPHFRLFAESVYQ